MITFTRTYVVGSTVYTKLVDAQVAALMQIGLTEASAAIAVERSCDVVNILTTTNQSRPSARKANGGTKTRKPKSPEEITTQETELL